MQWSKCLPLKNIVLRSGRTFKMLETLKSSNQDDHTEAAEYFDFPFSENNSCSFLHTTYFPGFHSHDFFYFTPGNSAVQYTPTRSVQTHN